MLNQYYTHRGVNQPPYFKGFPMSSVIVLGIILLISMLIGFLVAISIGHLLIGTTFAILLVAGAGYFSFNFLRKIGPFGYEKMLVKYFYRIDKIAGGRPIFHKVKLF
jgi:hypothetical protein